MYLQPQSVDQTFRTIRELAGAGAKLSSTMSMRLFSATKTCTMAKKVSQRPLQKWVNQWQFGIEKGEIGQFLSRYGFELRDHRDARELEEMYFKDPAGKIVGRVNGTHCIVRAVRTQS